MQAILDTAHRERWSVDFCAVISDRIGAPGLRIAANKNIRTHTISSKDYIDREAFEKALVRAIDMYAPDLILLAGFMRILTARFVNHYKGRLMNIHPSLLPSFTGLHTHKRALEAGVKIHGATVHFVTAELDGGPIIAQAAVPVLESDTEKSLAARVLVQEHQIYPMAVRWFLEDRLKIMRNKRVKILSSLVHEASFT